MCRSLLDQRRPYARTPDWLGLDACQALASRRWHRQAARCWDPSATLQSAVGSAPARRPVRPLLGLWFFCCAEAEAAHRVSVETAAETRPTDWPTQGCPRATCSAPWPRRRNHAVVPAIGPADWPRIARGASPAAGTADLGAGIEGATVRKWTKGEPANPRYTKSGQVSSAVGTPAKAVAGRRRVLWCCAGGSR